MVLGLFCTEQCCWDAEFAGNQWFVITKIITCGYVEKFSVPYPQVIRYLLITFIIYNHFVSAFKTSAALSFLANSFMAIPSPRSTQKTGATHTTLSLKIPTAIYPQNTKKHATPKNQKRSISSDPSLWLLGCTFYKSYTILIKSFKLSILIHRYGLRTSKSSSPVITNCAFPYTASSKIILSFISLQSLIFS